MNTTAANGGPKPFVRIVEQPAKCAIRFRYECEGRSAGSIPGVNSSAENKSFPTIQVCNYRGKAVVVVSCVTKEPPYRPHPHNLVGKEGCKKGVCTIVIDDNNAEMKCTFTSLGIQCVKRKDIEESLKLREVIKVDPFRSTFFSLFYFQFILNIFIFYFYQPVLTTALKLPPSISMLSVCASKFSLKALRRANSPYNFLPSSLNQCLTKV